MAIPDRKTSGLVIKVDYRGRLHLFVNGARVVGVVASESNNSGMVGGTVSFTLLSRFITFEHEDARAPEGVDAN